MMIDSHSCMQALSQLASECETAAAYIHANVEAAKDVGGVPSAGQRKEVDVSWKWDILRPVQGAKDGCNFAYE